jgi:hypothetical protein
MWIILKRNAKKMNTHVQNEDTLKLGHNKLGCERTLIMDRFLGQIGYIIAQIYPVITNPGYNERKWSAPSCSL